MPNPKEIPEKGSTLKQDIPGTLRQNVPGTLIQKFQKQNEENNSTEPETLLFRPVFRPPMGLLTVVHDGCETGQDFYMRTDSFRLGRSEGDVVIPHDNQISGLHCEITRRFEQGQWRWVLKDLSSRNGTFVMCRNSQLKHHSQLLIGCHRYRFDATGQDSVDDSDQLDSEQAKEGQTRGWQIPQDSDFEKLLPSIVRLSPEGDQERYVLAHNEQTLGSDANQCHISFQDDRMVSPVHSRIWQDSSNQWHIEDLDSLNKTWISIDEKILDMDMQFQIGEQRIVVKFL